MAAPRPTELELVVAGLDDQGYGVGQWQGHAIVVPDAFPGEAVRVKIDAWSQHHRRAFAHVITRLVAHPHRRLAPCVHHREHHAAGCTGCPLQSLSLPAQLQVLRENLIARYGWPLGPIESDGREWGYRWSAKRVCGRINGQVVLGSFQHNRHSLAAMRECLVDHPKIVAAFAMVEQAARLCEVEPYDEITQRGDLRYVWAKTNGTQVLVTLITADASSPAAKKMSQHLPSDLRLAWSVQGSHGNAIRGGSPQAVVGPPELAIELFGCARNVGPLGFLQPNPPMAARAYAALVTDENDEALRGDVAFDLYAGAGLTTTALRKTFAMVVPCENYPESAAALGVAARDAASFLTEFSCDHPGVTPDAIVANPPRAGMGAEVCAALCRIQTPRLNIMSCNATTLAGDLQALAPIYRLVALRGFATLPHTPHVEFVARLRAKREAGP